MSRNRKRRTPAHARAVARDGHPDVTPRNVVLAGLGAVSLGRRQAVAAIDALAAGAGEWQARSIDVVVGAGQQVAAFANQAQAQLAPLRRRAEAQLEPLRRQAEAIARDAEREFTAVAAPVLAKLGLVDAPVRRAAPARKSPARKPAPAARKRAATGKPARAR